MSEIENPEITPEETPETESGTEVTPEEVSQSMREVDFMSEILNDTNGRGEGEGLRTLDAPLLGATNDTPVPESDEESSAIDVIELEEGKAHHTVHIGRQGENMSQEVSFDCTAWAEKITGATYSIVARRNGENDTYLVANVAEDDGIVTWTINDEDTARAGLGEAEIRAETTGGIVKKSARFRVMVEKSVEDYTGGVVTPPYWAVEIIDQAAAAETAATTAEATVASLKKLVEYNNKVNAKMAPRGLTSVLTEPMEVGGIDQTGAEITTDNSRRSDFIAVQPNSGLYLTIDNEHPMYVRLYDSTKTYLRSVSLLTTAESREKESRIGSDVAYIRIVVGSMGASGDVYAIEWAVCSGETVVTLEENTDLLTLGVGAYYATSAIAATLTNCPVSTGQLTLRITTRSDSGNAMAILYQPGAIYVRYTMNNTGKWYKYEGVEVTE